MCDNPETFSNDLTITKVVLEVDSDFGEYGECNVCDNGTVPFTNPPVYVPNKGFASPSFSFHVISFFLSYFFFFVFLGGVVYYDVASILIVSFAYTTTNCRQQTPFTTPQH